MSWFPPLFLIGWTFVTRILLLMEEVIGGFTTKMALSEANTVEVCLLENPGRQPRRRFFLVGELLTSKAYRRDSLISTMRGLWIPKSGVGDKSRLTVCGLDGSKRLLFSFKDEADLKWVIKGCPWSFDKALFAVAVTDGLEDPMAVSLCTQFFWVRIRGLPPRFMDEYTGKCIGGALGHFLRIGEDRHGGCSESFIRIRVGIDVSKPLIKAVVFKPVDWTESKLVKVEYERLPHFCLFCGLLSHTGNSCPAREAGEITEPLYDVFIHAEKMEAWLAQ